ncbi:MAG TPA: ABC transporter permease [Candidatus Krumholzibacteria bacterium]|nr:ABC transporter permease [Candidatus Krumholzibacteria bacterium]
MAWRDRLGTRVVGDVRENLWMALDTLRAHKMRSGLAVIGIIVAVMTLISVVAILSGFDRNIQQGIQSFGTNTAFFNHLPSGPRLGRMSKELRMRKVLDYEDFVAVRDACTACVNSTVSVFSSAEVSRARYKGEEVVGLDFRGATDEFFSVYANAVIHEGRPFTAAENLHRVQCVVIGADLARGLFGVLDPLGKEILVNGHGFHVIGVLEKPKGSLGPGEAGQDRRVVVPYWTFRRAFPNDLNHGIRIEAYPGRLPEAIDQARTALRRSRKLPFDKEDNFSYNTAASIIREFHNIVGAVALVTMTLSGVGLLVGGVGVMNIMLVSVTERTREIGVRKAIGASRRDIIWQFLFEAMALTVAGGLVGVLAGILISMGIRSAMPALPAYVPPWAIVLGVSVAASVGLFFGIYPAVKAAKLDPVDALRYE